MTILLYREDKQTVGALNEKSKLDRRLRRKIKNVIPKS